MNVLRRARKAIVIASIVPLAAFSHEAARSVARSFSGLFYHLARSEHSLFAC